MRQRQPDRTFLSISIFAFFLMSVSFLLMPLENGGIWPGLFFWGGLLLGVVFQIVLEVRRRAFFRKYKVRKAELENKRCGLLTFASNKIGAFFDNLLVVSIPATILAVIFEKTAGYVSYVCLFLLVLSFCLHCVLNGKNYFHVNNQNKIRRELENKKESKIGKEEGKK